MPYATIVVPCYNEGARLDVAALRRFLGVMRNIQFLMVNDGSTDRTHDILQTLANDYPKQVRVFDLPCNCGKSEAVRLGMLAALADSPRYVGFLDADLATPLDELPHFFEVLDRRPEIELVIGTRLPLLGRQIVRHPCRRLLGGLFAAVASRVLGVPIVDTQCGAKVFRASPVMQVLLGAPFLSRWIFDVEIFARMIVLDRARSGGQRTAGGIAQRIYELPLERWKDVAGSRLRGKDFIRASIELLAIYWNYFVRQSTLHQAPLPTLATLPSSAAENVPSHRQAA